MEEELRQQMLTLIERWEEALGEALKAIRQHGKAYEARRILKHQVAVFPAGEPTQLPELFQLAHDIALWNGAIRLRPGCEAWSELKLDTAAFSRLAAEVEVEPHDPTEWHRAVVAAQAEAFRAKQFLWETKSSGESREIPRQKEQSRRRRRKPTPAKEAALARRELLKKLLASNPSIQPHEAWQEAKNCGLPAKKDAIRMMLYDVRKELNSG